MTFESIRGVGKTLSKLIKVDLSTLDPLAHEGAVARNTDDVLYISDGVRWSPISILDGEDRLSRLENIRIVTFGVSGNGSGVYESGARVSPQFVWTLDGPVDPIEQNFNGTPLSAVATSHTLPNITSSGSYTLAVTAPNGNVVTATTSISFQNRVYWGTAVNPTLTAAEVIALPNTRLQTSKALTETVVVTGEPKYIFYAYPTAWGNPASVSAHRVSTDYTASDVSLTTAAGFTGVYKVIRLNQRQAVNTPITVT